MKKKPKKSVKPPRKAVEKLVREVLGDLSKMKMSERLAYLRERKHGA